MYMDQTAPMAQDIYAEEQRIDHMYKDTYRQRKLEGRPNHTMLSAGILGLGLFSFLIQLGAVCMSNWRGNWIGVLGYPNSRQWGLWAVKGAKGTTWYHDQAQIACEIFGKMHMGGFCMSPLCLWYRVKCMTYWDMWMWCTAIGAGFVLVLLLHGACLAWTALLTPKSIQLASIFWCLVALSHVGLIAGWYFVSEDFFDAMNIYSFYPTPFLDFGFAFSSFAGLCVVGNAVLGIQLATQWPIPDTDWDSEESDDD